MAKADVAMKRLNQHKKPGVVVDAPRYFMGHRAIDGNMGVSGVTDRIKRPPVAGTPNMFG